MGMFMDYKGRSKVFKVEEPLGCQTLSPIQRDYENNQAVGDGLRNVIVRRTLDNRYFTPHIFAWDTPSHLMPPLENPEGFEFGKEGKFFKRSCGQDCKEVFNSSRYLDRSVGSLAYIVDPVLGFYGWLPNVIFMNPISMVDGDGLNVENECPPCCSDSSVCGDVKYTFKLITACLSPFTYPLNDCGEGIASAYRPVGVGVRAEDKKCQF